MLQSVQTAKQKAILHKPLSPEDWRISDNHTVVMMVISVTGHLLLVRRKSLARRHGFIFPQGRIQRRNETLFEAATRILQAEVGLTPELIDHQAAQFLLKQFGPAPKCKYYQVVALPLTASSQLHVQEDKRKAFWAGGPLQLVKNITDCSVSKTGLMQSALSIAMEEGLLFSSRWKAPYTAKILQAQ